MTSDAVTDARSEPGREQPVPEMTRLRRELLRANAAEAERDALRRTVARQRDELSRLARRLDDVYASTTWRVGRALVAPVTRLRRRRGGR